MQKGTFENMSSGLQLLMVVVIIGISTIVITLLSYLLAIPVVGLDEFSLSGSTGILRYLQISQAFSVFIIPPVIAAFLFSKTPMKWLWFRKSDSRLIIISLLLFLISIPLISFLAEFNSSMKFPAFMQSIEQWMRSTEKMNNDLIFKFLDTKQPLIILINIFMIVLIPAFGEEMLFRGTIQPLFQKIFKSQHIAVWVTAFLFSAIHLQFLTFLPRFILGAMLGYLLVYGKSLWYPIVGHFINNFTSLIVFYYYRATKPEINPLEPSSGDFNSIIILSSFAVTILLFYVFIKLCKKPEIIKLQ